MAFLYLREIANFIVLYLIPYFVIPSVSVLHNVLSGVLDLTPEQIARVRELVEQ